MSEVMERPADLRLIVRRASAGWVWEILAGRNVVASSLDDYDSIDTFGTQGLAEAMGQSTLAAMRRGRTDPLPIKDPLSKQVEWCEQQLVRLSDENSRLPRSEVRARIRLVTLALIMINDEVMANEDALAPTRLGEMGRMRVSGEAA